LRPCAATSSIASAPNEETAMPDSNRTLDPVVEDRAAPAGAGGRALLLAAIAGLAAFGAALVLLPDPVARLFGWIAYGSADRVAAFGPDAVAYIQLVHAILGAMTVGWALTMLAVVAWFWRSQAGRAWLAVAVPAAIWFVLDSGYSIASGFWRNAVLNALFALAFAVPLLLLRPARAAGSRR
jgi:hypothetical protein